MLANRRWLRLGGWLLVCALCTSTALADERSEARRAFRQGMAMIHAGRVEQGIAQLQTAYEILPHPAVLYNIGMAYLQAGQDEQALEYFLKYRAEMEQNPDAVPEPALERLVQALQENVQEDQQQAQAQPAQPAEPGEAQAAQAAQVSDDDVAAMRETAQKLRQLGEDTDNPELKERAARLDRTADKLAGEGAEPGEPAPQADGAEVAEERETAPNLKDLRQTDDSDVYEERVVSASRVAESPVVAPNATAVVTSQDIRLSGIKNIPELLRKVAGVEVMRVSPSHSEVSIRGLNRRNSTKVLVLLDGRSVRQDFLGTTWWEMIPVSIEDIERIEVIRGPASALYGADAFSGIINIITRPPGEGKSYVEAAGGNKGQARGVTSLTGRTESNMSWRLGGGYAQQDDAVRLLDPDRIDYVPATDTPTRANQRMWVNGEIEQVFDNRVAITAGGRALLGDDDVQGTGRLGQTTVDDSLVGLLYTTVETPIGLRLSSWWNRLEGNAGTSTLQRAAINLDAEDVTQDIVDVELRWSDQVNWGVPQALAVGVGYRYKSIQDWTWLDDDHTQHHYSAYLQDQLTLHPRLRVQVSARMDRHPLLEDVQFSPRGSVVVLLSEGQSVRAVIGKAFRGPSFLESYLQVQNGTSIRGVSAWGVGSTSLDPESITSFELGYTNQATDIFALEANAYFNLLKDEILFTDVDPFTVSDFQNPSNDLADFNEDTGSFPISTLGYENENATFRQIGGELGVRVFPVRGLDVYTNYSIHDTSPLDDGDVDDERADQRETSLHKVNAGAQYRSTVGIDVSIDLHWLSPQVWVEQIVDTERGVRFESFDQPSTLLVNARVGYRLMDDRLELGLAGYNLTFTDKRQHPFGQPLDTRVLASARLNF